MNATSIPSAFILTLKISATREIYTSSKDGPSRLFVTTAFKRSPRPLMDVLYNAWKIAISSGRSPIEKLPDIHVSRYFTQFLVNVPVSPQDRRLYLHLGYPVTKYPRARHFGAHLGPKVLTSCFALFSIHLMCDHHFDISIIVDV